ncbi:MAG: rane fusion protein multidrug efflux system [Gammaproteobacteria bacterium]|jgi:RND family efflux transporter MFP subunit|nr:rane fusion protein multidrug efflux system [Gammaproteobacteria bacterium]
MRIINKIRGFSIVVCLMPFIAGCGKSGGPAAPPPPQVSVAQVLEKRVKDWDEFTGRLQAVETVEIRPRVSGYIDKVAFTEGSLVKRGTLLFVIDPRPYQAEYDRAAADLKRFKTALDLGRIELVRVQRLKESGAVSEEELDERKSTVAQAEANAAGSQAALEAAALNLNFTKVSSPIDGRVSRAEVTRGNLVTGGTNGGTLLSSVVSMDPIYIYFDADEQSYLRYSQNSHDSGKPVQVGLANEDGFPHTGTVDFVDNQLNPQTGTIRARAVLQNKDGRFTPGLFARVQLLGNEEYSAILIDDRAVNTDQNQKYVLLLGANNQIEYRKVKLGRVIDGLRVVREGLKAGDVVVVNGAQRVHPGVTVTPQKVTMGATAPAAS